MPKAIFYLLKGDIGYGVYNGKACNLVHDPISPSSHIVHPQVATQQTKLAPNTFKKNPEPSTELLQGFPSSTMIMSSLRGGQFRGTKV